MSLSLFACGGSGDGGSPAGDDEAVTSAPAGSVERAVSSSCSTGAVHGLAVQLVQEIECMQPGTLTRIDAIPNVTVSDVVFPYLQESAATALAKAAEGTSITINSALRTIPQQYLLYRWYSSGKRCGVRLAARVGKSNHEQGLAVDVQDHPDALGKAGFRWFGRTDPVHWDFRGGGGEDLVGMSTKAFQRLWNRNHPEDKVPEDGVYGPGTELRLRKSPAAGFDVGASCQAAADAGAAGDDQDASNTPPVEGTTEADEDL